jgi:hypothetical protein
MREILFTCTIFLLMVTILKSQNVKMNPPAGRIAIIADGNSPDPDDLGGTAVSLALLRAAGLENRLVHYSHSCDLIVLERISEDAEKERHHMMQIASEGTARRWGGFDHITFYDAKWNTDKTTLDLRDAIMASTADDPLWIRYNAKRETQICENHHTSPRQR